MGSCPEEPVLCAVCLRTTCGSLTCAPFPIKRALSLARRLFCTHRSAGGLGVREASVLDDQSAAFNTCASHRSRAGGGCTTAARGGRRGHGHMPALLRLRQQRLWVPSPWGEKGCRKEAVVLIGSPHRSGVKNLIPDLPALSLASEISSSRASESVRAAPLSSWNIPALLFLETVWSGSQ